METERRRRIEEERQAKEEQASQAEIHRIQEEERVRHAELEAEQAHEKRRRAHMIAKLKQSQADELRLIQEENARLELEQQAFQQRIRRTPSPLPQNYLAPNPYMWDPYSYPAHLLPPQPLYPPQTQGGISLQNVSGSNISINSTPPPPVVNNINHSGNIANLSFSNVNNNNTKRKYHLHPIELILSYSLPHVAHRKAKT